MTRVVGLEEGGVVVVMGMDNQVHAIMIPQGGFGLSHSLDGSRLCCSLDYRSLTTLVVGIVMCTWVRRKKGTRGHGGGVGSMVKEGRKEGRVFAFYVLILFLPQVTHY